MGINASLPQHCEWLLCGDYFGIASAPVLGRLPTFSPAAGTVFPLSALFCPSPVGTFPDKVYKVSQYSRHDELNLRHENER
jgi:hypothetical protein